MGLGLQENDVPEFHSLQSENLLAAEDRRGIGGQGILAGVGILLVEVVPAIIPLFEISPY